MAGVKGSREEGFILSLSLLRIEEAWQTTHAAGNSHRGERREKRGEQRLEREKKRQSFEEEEKLSFQSVSPHC